MLFLGSVVPGSPMHVSKWWLSPSDNGRSVRKLIHALSDPDPTARREAAQSLGRLNTDATEALPRLAEVMRQDTDPDVRAAAASAISKMAPASRAVVTDLAAALHDPEPRVRMNATLALLYLKTEASPAIPDLIVAANDEDNDTNIELFTFTVRQAAIQALGAAAAGTSAAVATLTEVLSQPASDATRAAAVQGLGLAGSPAREAAPLIRALLHDPNANVRLAAEEALTRIGVDRNGPVKMGEFDNLQLPEAERERIWEIEHRGNVLNKYGFGPFAAALTRSDATELTRFLTADFVGSQPEKPIRVRASGFANVERLQDAGPSTSLTAAQFVARLIELRQMVGTAPKVKLVVATLQPKAADAPNGLWMGRALLRIHGEEKPGAPAEVTAVLAFEVRSPTEASLAEGKWLHAASLRELAVARSPHYFFAERAKARGLNTALHDNWTSDTTVVTSGGVYVTDFDRDGYLDVLVTDLTGHTLYRGGPDGMLRDVSEQVGLSRKPVEGTKAAAWVDLDGDGWDDLILDTHVYRNVGGKTFEDYTDRCSLKVPTDLSGIHVADYDRDGKLDLYFSRSGRPGNMSWLEGRSNDARGNRLYQNLGNWKFEDVTKKSGTRGGYRSSFTAAWLDINDDGWPDLYVPNEFGDGVLLVNNHDGTFKPHSLADHPTDFGTMGLAVGDIDNDGRIDIYSANMYSKAGTRVIGNMKPDAYPPKVMQKLRRLVAGSQLHLNKGGLKFEHVGEEKRLATVGWAYGVALADLDGDGFLDVYANAGYMSRDRDKPDG